MHPGKGAGYSQQLKGGARSSLRLMLDGLVKSAEQLSLTPVLESHDSGVVHLLLRIGEA